MPKPSDKRKKLPPSRKVTGIRDSMKVQPHGSRKRTRGRRNPINRSKGM